VASGPSLFAGNTERGVIKPPHLVGVATEDEFVIVRFVHVWHQLDDVHEAIASVHGYYHDTVSCKNIPASTANEVNVEAIAHTAAVTKVSVFPKPSLGDTEERSEQQAQHPGFSSRRKVTFLCADTRRVGELASFPRRVAA
jgi:hypothetical protein